MYQFIDTGRSGVQCDVVALQAGGLQQRGDPARELVHTAAQHLCGGFIHVPVRMAGELLHALLDQRQGSP